MAETLEALVETAVKDAGVDGFDLDIDSEGGISFVKPDSTNAETGGTDGKGKEEKPADGVLKTDDKPAADAAAGGTDFEARYKEVQGTMTKYAQENAELKSTLTQVLKNQLTLQEQLQKGSQTPSAETESEPDLESLLADKTAFAKFISGLVVEAVETKLGKDAPDVMNRNRLGLELQNTAAAHSDFSVYVPDIKILVDEFPDASFEQLYQTAKKLRPVTTKPAAGESATKEVKPAANAETVESLKAKADALKTESGVNGNISDKKKITSIKDAIAAALSEHGL